MKRISFLLVTLFSLSALSAQNVIDGLRYSQEKINGTARFQALSGAMGALGGDLSAMAANPAGSAVFIKSYANISIGIFDKTNDVNYFNNNTRAIFTDASLNQAGGVFVFDNDNLDSVWKKFTLGLNYDTTNNFGDDVFIAGKSNASVDQFFLAQAQGIPLNSLTLQGSETNSDLYSFLGQNEGVGAQNAFLGYQSFIIDPVNPDDGQNTEYISNLGSGTFNQEYNFLSDGQNSKFTFNLGAQVTDNLYFGLNLNSLTIDYRQSTLLFETNTNVGSRVSQIGFENNLSVLGSGFSAQFGAIAKLGENFRFGLNVDTPTWYTISEETTQSLQTIRNENGQNVTAFINPNIINVYEDYTLKTPAKVGLSAAYIFGTKGLISFDYSYKDYSKIEFRPTNDSFFTTLNQNIDSSLKSSATYRVGGEYRIDKASLRAGYWYEESPYENNEILDSSLGFSFGAGYNFGNYNLDLAYSRAEQDKTQRLYNTGLTTAGSVNSAISNIILTLGFQF